MGFFKKFQLGKVIGGAAQGFLTAGPKGAIAGAGIAALQSGAKAAQSRASSTATPIGTPAQFGGVQNDFRPMPTFASERPSSGGVPAIRGSVGTMTGDVYNALLVLADRLGVTIRNPNSVVPVGRNLLAKLIRFSRATPGLTILTMLIQLGVSALAANQLVAWYSTGGKRHKRIRVTNIKALKRSVRRLEGFRKLALRVEASLGRRRGSAVKARVGRCRTCHKNPCGC